MQQFDHLFQAAGNTSGSFIVEVDGSPIGRFTQVEGLQVNVEVETYKEGGVNGFEHQFPGRLTYPTVKLTRGITWDNNMMAWFDQTSGAEFLATGSVTRETAAITMISANGRRLRSWTLFDAMPIAWTGPSLANGNDEVPVEELEVIHHGFEAYTFPPQ